MISSCGTIGDSWYPATAYSLIWFIEDDGRFKEEEKKRSQKLADGKWYDFPTILQHWLPPKHSSSLEFPGLINHNHVDNSLIEFESKEWLQGEEVEVDV